MNFPDYLPKSLFERGGTHETEWQSEFALYDDETGGLYLKLGKISEDEAKSKHRDYENSQGKVFQLIKIQKRFINV